MTRRQSVSMLTCTAGLALAFAAPPARAADVSDRGAITLSADRFFGLSMSKATTGGDDSESRTEIGLLTPPAYLPPAYATPRLALDYTAIERLTVGVALGFAAGSRDDETNGSSSDGPSYSLFLVQPRIGWVLGLPSDFSLWLRGGVTYSRGHLESGNIDATTWDVGLDLEPTLVYMAASHFGLTAGAVIDLPIDGETETSTRLANTTLTTTSDHGLRNFGIVFGLLGVF